MTGLDFSTGRFQTPKRFCAVNAVRMREFRLENGLSQAELARRSGYTARLIRKAESGGSLNYETIQDIAAALSASGIAVKVDELIFDPVLIVEEFIDAYARIGASCIQRTRPYFASDIELHCTADPQHFPFAGCWSGIERLSEFFELFCGSYERASKKLVISYLSGNECVAARFEDWFVYNGIELPAIRFNWHFEFRSGMIVRIDFEFDQFTASTILQSLNQNGL